MPKSIGDQFQISSYII